MEEKTDKQIEAIAKIISLTRKNELTWETLSYDNLPKKYANEIVDSAYLTYFKNKPLRIYRRRYRVADTTSNLNSVIRGVLSSSDGWITDIILDITNDEGQSLWQFPEEAILNDLLKVIKYKTSGAEDIINSLLEE